MLDQFILTNIKTIGFLFVSISISAWLLHLHMRISELEEIVFYKIEHDEEAE